MTVQFRRRPMLVLLIAAIVGLAALMLSGTFDTGTSDGASPPVSVFPIPNDQVASPKTQLAFRGIPASNIGSIVVKGSQSGVHSGTIKADSDGNGGSFLPSKSFTAGETVSVSTSLNVRGASNGDYRFAVANPTNPVPIGIPAFAGRHSGDVAHFHSRPDLQPVNVTVTKDSSQSQGGYIFVAPQAGPVQNGPMILDDQGHAVWFKALPRNDVITDFREQTYRGKPVLTWWQGSWNAAVGRGVDVINNSAYQVIDTVRAANGMDADLHEFQITKQNTALITAYYPVYWNLSSVHGSSHAIVFDCIVQEIDIPTGLVLFQWDSLDHIPLNYSYSTPPTVVGHPYNYFHVNSISQDDDGNLIISARNTSAAYKLDHNTGAVLWELGGKHSSFKMGPHASFTNQHDVRERAQRDAVITVFDDGNERNPSRALKLRLDLSKMTATEIVQDYHSPKLVADFEGNVQQLPNYGDFVGWGQQPWWSEYTESGQLVYDAHFDDFNPTYRAYRFHWIGTPQTKPAVAAAKTRHGTTIWVSWNGDTAVHHWRVLGGGSPTSMKPLATWVKHGFETTITAPSANYIAVQATDAKGRLLGTSLPVKPH